MQTLTLASNEEDAAAIDTIARHHAELSGELALKTSALLDAVANHDEADAQSVRPDLVRWSRSVLLTYLRVESEVFYPALQRTSEGALLDAELRRERTRLVDILEQLDVAGEALDAAVSAVSLRVILGSYLRVEAEKVLPALAMSAQDSLASLWAGIVLVTRDRADSATAHSETAHSETASSSHSCACGILNEGDHPELDVRTVPHAIRHATVFGALDSIGPGGGLILIAPHDPLPLLAQIEERTPGRFTVAYLQRGPEDWRLQFAPLPL